MSATEKLSIEKARLYKTAFVNDGSSEEFKAGECVSVSDPIKRRGLIWFVCTLDERCEVLPEYALESLCL